MWHDLVGNDPAANRVRKRAFQFAPYLNADFAFLNENKEDSAIVTAAVTNTPASKRLLSEVLHRSVGRQFRENGEKDLIRSIALELFQRLVP
jgi:hypothetical protein